MSKPKFLVMNILGTPLPLLETQRKPKEGETEVHTYYCFRESGSTAVRFGVKVEALDEKLPTQVEIDGVVVSLERGLTAAEFRNSSGQTIAIAQADRRNRVSTKQFQVVPSLVDESAGDTGLRNVEVSISETSNVGVWNVKVVVNRSGLNSASPEKKAENAQKRAQSTMAEFAAILAGMGVNA
jgi:hypothetical protein